MSLPDPNPVWLQRWTSLAKSITDTRENCKTEEPFAQLLADLQKFGKKQFYYFYLGFSHDTQPDATLLAAAGCDKTTRPQRLEKDHDYPPDYVLRTIIDQVSYDYEVIQRALHQRLSGTDAQKDALEKADRWGQALLQPVVATRKADENGNLGLLDFQPAVITYFNRSPMIRMIPYANVALLGIPMTVTGAPLDLLALPHELGHYVYWHGRIGDKSIRSQLRDIVQGEMPYIKNWIEEIFADVFGFLVSSEMAILPWVIDMISDNAPTEYVRDNNVHPINAVRPHIYVNTIRALKNTKKLAEQTKSWQENPWLWFRPFLVQNEEENEEEKEDVLTSFLNLLSNRIESLRKISGGHVEFSTVNRLGNEETIKLDIVQARLVEIVSRIVNEILIRKNDHFHKWGARLKLLKWDEKLNALEKSIQLPEMPDNPAQQFSISPPLEPASPPFRHVHIFRDFMREQAVQNWYTAFEKSLASVPAASDVDKNTCLTAPKITWSFKTIRDTKEFERPLESNVWKLVFAADGWTIKGPETGPVGGWEPGPDWTHTAFHL